MHDSHMRQAPDFLNRQSTPVNAGAGPCKSEIGQHPTLKHINKSHDSLPRHVSSLQWFPGLAGFLQLQVMIL